MRTEVIEDYSEYAFFAVTLEVVDRYNRKKWKTRRGICTPDGSFPLITKMLGLISNKEGAGSCSVLKVEYLRNREEYLKIIKK